MLARTPKMMILAKALGGQSEKKLLNIHGVRQRERERERELERENSYFVAVPS